MGKKYFFEVTDIARHVETEITISGIQRVSFEAIKRAVTRFGSEHVKISFWDDYVEDYVAVDAELLLDMDEFDAGILREIFFGHRDRAPEPAFLDRYSDKPLKHLFHRFYAPFQAARGNADYFESRSFSLEKWRKERAKARPDYEGPTPADDPTDEIDRQPVADLIAPGDQIVILGATWGMDAQNARMEQLSGQGARISLLVHDLIPLVQPEHINGDFSMTFYQWLERSTGYCDHYFANSENTARDLHRFMQEVGAERPVQVVPLIQSMGRAPARDTGKPFLDMVTSIDGLDRRILNITKLPYVLVVGTMESRKNLWRLVQAWARLAQDRDIEVPKLVLAGKSGWYIDDVMNWMKASGNLNGWVEIAEKPSDRELAFLYENCTFTAMVSLYEGWGLPIGEGLGFGKTGVVADNSSMPEVGGDLVEYCDAESIDSIYRACRKLIADPDHRKALEARIAATRLRTWDDVTEDIIGYLEAS